MNVYEIVTERIIKELEAGTVPWRRPWDAPKGGPRNLVSGKAYRGINRFLLPSPGGCPWFVTYKQATELGGHVRKGEKASPVIFWKVYGKDVTDAATGETKRQSRFVLRYYSVFSVTQCDGLDAHVPQPEELSRPAWECQDHAESIVNEYTGNGGPSLDVGNKQDKAYYVPLSDSVSIPACEDFPTASRYYGTLFHELGHSTGHPKRLARYEINGKMSFASEGYSREELVAEMTAAFLAAESGVGLEELPNHAAYVQSWLDVLHEDSRLVVIAAAQAQKAADLILGVDATQGTDGDWGDGPVVDE